MNYIDTGASLLRDDGLVIPKNPANGDYQQALATGTINPEPAPTKTQLKSTVTSTVNAFGFSLDQIRIIRAVLLLISGTPQQKIDAQAFLQPLLKMLIDVSSATTEIDAGQVPSVIPKPVLPTVDP